MGTALAPSAGLRSQKLRQIMGRLVVLAPKKLLMMFAAVGLLFAAAPIPVRAQDAAASTKNWKDRDEYDLYVSITKEADAGKRVALLDTWKSKYPTTDYKSEREILYVTTYAQAGKPDETIAAAKQALAADPENVTALYWATLDTPYAKPSPDNLDFGEKCAKGLLNAKKPAGISDADWEKTKAQLQFDATGHSTLGWVALQKKDDETAEKEFEASLKANPNNGQVSYWKGQAILAQKKPDKQAAALYDIARAAAYDGPGAMPTGRDAVKTYLTKVYGQYHGSNDGFDELMAKAKASAFPGDYKVLSSVEIEQAKANAAAEAAKNNPMLALWTNMKGQLTATGGQDYFNSGVKDADLPGTAVPGVTKFKGKLVSEDPETKPKTLILSIEDGKTPDVTLELDAPLPGKADPGTELQFSGVAKSFTASPFGLTFAVEKKNIEGWPVKAEAPVHHAPVRRKK